MATSFLTQAQKNVIDGLVDSVHATFSVSVTSFATDKKSSLATNPNFNSIYRSNSAQVPATERSLTFNARVKYVKMGEEVFQESDGSSVTSVQNRIILPVGSVKMKVDATAHEFMKIAKRVEISNKRYIVQGNPRPVGFFGKENYWEYFLIPTD